MHSWQHEFQQALIQHFHKLRQQNPKLSIRTFAKRARMSSGGMAQFLKGNQKWKLSPARALQILDSLGAEDNVKRYFAALTGQPFIMPWKQMAKDRDALLKDWSFFPILHSFDLKPQPTSAEIAKKLNMDVNHVEAAIHFLLEIGALKKNEDGSMGRETTPQKTSDGPPNEVIRNFHKTNLNIALKALDTIPSDERDFTALTLAGDRAQIEFVKAEIRKLFDRVLALMESTSQNNEVYRLSVNFFPLNFDRKETRS